MRGLSGTIFLFKKVAPRALRSVAISGAKPHEENASARNRTRVTSMATMYSTNRQLMLGWAQMGPSARRWLHLRPSARRWGHVRPSARILGHLRPSARRWGHLRPSARRCLAHEARIIPLDQAADGEEYISAHIEIELGSGDVLKHGWLSYTFRLFSQRFHRKDGRGSRCRDSSVGRASD